MAIANSFGSAFSAADTKTHASSYVGAFRSAICLSQPDPIVNTQRGAIAGAFRGAHSAALIRTIAASILCHKSKSNAGTFDCS